MPKLTRRQLIILTLGGFLSYLLFGMFDSMRGATLSVLLTDLDLSYTAGGSVVMGQYAGYFAATLLVGILADRTGPKFTLVLAACSLIFGVAGYAASSGLPALIAFIFFIGIGLGSLELGGCNIIAAIYKEKKGRYLNILAAIAGCGAFVTPMIAGLFLDQGVSWRLIYRSGLLIAVPAAVYFVLLRWPPSFRHAGNAKETSAPSPGSFRESATSARHPRRARSLAVLSMNLSNFAYMAAEIGTATWLVDFYCHVKHFSILEASTGLSLFYIGITLDGSAAACSLTGQATSEASWPPRSLQPFASLAGLWGRNPWRFLLPPADSVIPSSFPRPRLSSPRSAPGIPAGHWESSWHSADSAACSDPGS